MTELWGKVALVTGASRGIGAETARALARRGAAVVLAARSLAQTEAVVRSIRAEDGQAMAISCDVSRWQDVARAIEATTARFGAPDILVNNAGVVEPIARLSETDPAAWGKLIDVNVKGVHNGLRAVLPGMAARGSGVIVNISSGAATSPLEGWSAYCASKAAVLMLTRCVHLEFAGQGVRCVGLSPGTVATDMQAAIKASGINPVSQLDWAVHIPPDWAARAVAWACTDDAREFDGGDISLRDEDIRRRVGLID